MATGAAARGVVAGVAKQTVLEVRSIRERVCVCERERECVCVCESVCVREVWEREGWRSGRPPPLHTPSPCLLPTQPDAQAAQRGLLASTARYSAVRGALSFLGPLMWGALALDLALKSIGTDYARIVRAVFILAQVGIRGE
jgi:hypothetical protein